METEGLLFQAFIYLLAAVATVPIAKQLGLGSVLGYLLAGVIIGPHLLGLVGHGGGGVMHVAEFGVVMMLFLVGLELRPSSALAPARPDHRDGRRSGHPDHAGFCRPCVGLRDSAFKSRWRSG